MCMCIWNTYIKRDFLFWHFSGIPVLLLIQMRLSVPTVDVFPTAIVNGTCQCKLQRIAMSGTRPAFIGPVFGWTDIRKQEGWSVTIVQHQSAGNGARNKEGVKWEYEGNESVIAATAKDRLTPGSGWGLLSLSESYRGRLCCPDSWFSPFSTGWKTHSLHERIHQTIRLIKAILKTCRFSQNCIRAELK